LTLSRHINPATIKPKTTYPASEVETEPWPPAIGCSSVGCTIGAIVGIDVDIGNDVDVGSEDGTGEGAAATG
jgi:hypothetical protein